MHICPTDSGGRIVEGSTPFGRFRVEWDAAGKLVSESCVPGTPSQPAPSPPRPPRKSPQPSGGTGGKPRRLLGPGSWLAMLIQVATLGYVRPCTSCKSRARSMDRAGWRGLPRLGWRWAKTAAGLTPPG